MKNTSYTKRSIYLILFFIIGCTSSLYGMEGAGVYFKASLCGKIYKHLSFLVEEDIRPRDDFKEAEWFLTTVEVNYKFNKYLLAGSGYMSLARYKASDIISTLRGLIRPDVLPSLSGNVFKVPIRFTPNIPRIICVRC